ncbi:MAG TPA: class I SAM-dependent methyltransferase [Bryobacteraceae bacterium]|nr:class I SAM-dependent methyltransferase [Bryobacteraceae bacterium]
MNSADRFSDRVEDYVRYRPGYPRELLEVLRKDCGLTSAAAIADIGCGPGNLAVVFLENANTVFGVEPNTAMREASEKVLQKFPRFHPVDGRAEVTSLPPASVDFAVAGQAFHWFEPIATRAEFRRILKPGGCVALIWNERAGASPFDEAYEAVLLRYGTDYKKIRESRGDHESIAAFFESEDVRRATFTHRQWFDYDGLKGRLLSSSYAPPVGHPTHEPMLNDLRQVFDSHHEAGRVLFQYETMMWYGRLAR